VSLAHALVGLLTLGAAAVWFSVTRTFQAAAAVSASLERRVPERTAEISFLAAHDMLTGLANRAHLTQHLDQLLQDRGNAQASLFTLALDLDNFKAINDTFGHPAGDAVLTEFSTRLRSTLGEYNLAARLGGDEFVIVVPGSTDSAAEGLARRLLDVMDEPFVLDGQHIHVGVSIGIARSPTDGSDSATLLRNADIALYRAKDGGRRAFRFFEAAMDASLRERQALEKQLRDATARQEFVLHYQPLISAATGSVTGFEALVRWQHPERGLLPPSQFIPLAEDIGLIGDLGQWVLQQACLEAATWPEALNVAVNLSPDQFRQKTLALSVVAALDQSGLAASRVELEITESALLDNSEDTLAVLHQLRTLGVRIAMDDFGTDFSSLSYLRSFPFDRIKIDRSFILEINDKKECLSIVNAVAALGQSLGMATTAEGIETAEQLLLVQAQGCTELQGYYFNVPLPPAEIDGFLAGSFGLAMPATLSGARLH